MSVPGPENGRDRDLRKLSTEELAKLGEDSLRKRLAEQAEYARAKHSPLGSDKIEALLADPECTRYPTRLVFEIDGMAAHQFAQPEVDYRNPEQDGRVLYLRPMLRERPELVMLAVAYMLPVLNYGEEIVNDSHCLLYGATLLAMNEEEFYQAVCGLADFTGCEPRDLTP